MWIVLSAPNDNVAQWAIVGLAARGLAPLEWVTSESLPSASWAHRVGTANVGVDLVLPDGRMLRSDAIQGVLNRIQWIAGEHAARAMGYDQLYVQQEMIAFYLSWIHALPAPLLNPPRPQGLAGAFRHPSDWFYLAARAGFACPPYRVSSRAPYDSGWEADTGLPPAITALPRIMLFVVGEHVIAATGDADPPEAIASCARRLAKLCGAPLISIELAVAMDHWFFTRADAVPDLRRGGERLLDALADTLSPGRERAHA